jgi:hypothetical protein
MHISHRLRRTIGVLASATLAMGAIAIASPAAHADGTLSGPTTANISQNVTYTFTSAPEGQLQLEDQNGQVLTTVTESVFISLECRLTRIRIEFSSPDRRRCCFNYHGGQRPKHSCHWSINNDQCERDK